MSRQRKDRALKEKTRIYQHGLHLCPLCGASMVLSHEVGRAHRYDHPHRMSRDHILPREWGGALLGRIARNTRWCCQECNRDRASCGHCVGAMACARAVAKDRGVHLHDLLRLWGMAQVILQIKVPGWYPTRHAQAQIDRQTPTL